MKPEKAEDIENSIINDARMGRITGKLTEAQLIQRIEEYEAVAAKTTLKIAHKYKDPEEDIDLSGL